MRRGRWKTACACGADLAPSHGRSTSPLAAVRRILLLLLCTVATIATAQLSVTLAVISRIFRCQTWPQLPLRLRP